MVKDEVIVEEDETKGEEMRNGAVMEKGLQKGELPNEENFSD